MQYEGEGDGAGSSKTIDFVYDPEVDTPDEIAVSAQSVQSMESVQSMQIVLSEAF